MIDGSLHYLSIRQLGARIAAREVSPVEVTEAILDRIGRLDKRLNTHITVMGDEAIERARRAEDEMSGGSYLGPLHGVPVGLKDLYQTRGVRTTGGSKILSDWVPAEDAAVTERLRDAGAVIVGKHNMHELAFGVSNDNPHYGRVHNPWNAERVPGGSSGGSAAAVAAGLCYAAMGSDTGGSIRLPAAACGVVGLKPTYGLVSRYGVLPLAWSLDHAGPFGRTVDDVAIVMDAILGYDPRDPSSADRSIPRLADVLDQGINGTRIGLLHEYLGEDVQPDVLAAVRAAAVVLDKLGADVEQISVPSASHALGVSTAILYAEAAAVHEQWVAQRPADYSEGVLQRLKAGARLTATQYLKAQRARRVMIGDFQEVFGRIDLVLTPTVPSTALTWDEAATPGGPEALIRFTRLFNVLGLPACSVPCGFGDDGMPIGLQIVGRAFEDAAVLRAAYAYEQATDWHTLRPPV